MAYTQFADNSPIADDSVEDAINDTRNNLLALRDSYITGYLYGWNYSKSVGGGSAQQPDEMYWSKSNADGTTDRLKADLTWGTYGPTVIDWYWHRDVNDLNGAGLTQQLIGTETLTWAADGTLTSTAWSGIVAAPVFTAGKPIPATDTVLQTIDYIRENLMATRDLMICGHGNDWDYSWTGGTSVKPGSVRYKLNGIDRIQGDITWNADNTPASIQWNHYANDAAGANLIGTQTFTWSSQWCTAWTWSGTPTHIEFQDAKPVTTEADADDSIDHIRNNLYLLREYANFMGAMPDWNYSQTGDAWAPTTQVFTKGTDKVRGSFTYGTSGDEDGHPTQIIFERDTGGGYETVGTVAITYDDVGIVSTVTWS